MPITVFFMITRRLSLFLALILSISSLAQSSYEKGLNAFLENDRDEAIDHLEESIMDGENLAESHLVLCFIYSQIYRSDKCYYHMKEFISNTDNPYPYIITLWGSSEVGLGTYCYFLTSSVNLQNLFSLFLDYSSYS